MTEPKGQRSWFAFTVHRPVTITMVTLAVLVLGALAYQRLPMNLMPELTYPTITVRTEYPAAAPEEVEDAISRPIEEALGVVHSLVRISSVSRAELSDVILEFQWDTPMDDAIQEVREKLDQVVLPQEVRPPIVLRYDPNADPIMTLALYGDAPLTYLRYIADEFVKPELEGIDGVAAVRVKGGLEEEVHVQLDEDQLTQIGLSIQEIIARLRAENVNLAGGKILEGQTEYLVRTINEFKTIEDIRNIIVGYRQGAPIYLKDIARVTSSHEERKLITRVNGQEAVLLEIYREGDANIVTVAQRVRERLVGSAAYHRLKAQQEEAARKRRAALERRARERARPGVRPQRPPQAGRRPPARGRRGMAALLAQTREKPLVERLPRGLSMAVLSDQSKFIKSAIAEVRQAALFGGLIAILVIYLFLRKWSTTLIVAVTIPASVVATFLVMHLLGISLNMMSLGGLALGIGMLVDNAVVVLESIHRCLEEGDGLIPAVLRGTGEVGLAVSASTFTTICVFFPMIFVEGVAGQLFGDQAVTIMASLLASLAIALFLIPMLRSRSFRVAAGDGLSLRDWFLPLRPAEFLADLRSQRPAPGLYLLKPLAWVLWLGVSIFLLVTRVFMLAVGAALFLGWMGLRLAGRGLAMLLTPGVRATDRFYRALLRGYEPLLRGALRHPLRVFLVLALVLGSVLVILRDIGTELIPEVHQGEFTLMMEFPVGTALSWTDTVLSGLADQIRSFPEVDRVVTFAGSDPEAASLYQTEGDHTGRLTVFLKPFRDLTEAETRVLDRIRGLLSQYPQVRYTVRRPTLFSMRNPIEVEIRGDNLAVLQSLGEQVLARVRAVPGVEDAVLNLGEGFPEIQIRYDRERLAQAGLDLLQVAEMIRDKVLGNPATELRRGDQRVDIRVMVAPQARETIQDLIQLNVNPSGRPPIPLRAVADIEIIQGPSEIRRIQQRRVALITARLKGFDLGGTARRISAALADIERPPGYDIVVSGQSREMETSLRSMRLALALAVFLVYVVMASQFESFLNPFIIMFAIPLASVGVLWVLWIGGFTLNVVVLIGLIILSGIVVNNAIVLLDYVQQLRARGLSTEAALVTAGKVRLRPILITTLTTVLALLPMALGLGEGAELRQPMAWTIIAGLSSSTLLTLVLIPVLYALFDRARRRLGRSATASG